MPVEDVAMTRLVQREVGRRYIDSTRLDVRAMHGVVYMHGSLKRLRGHDIDLKHELEVICRIIRSKPGIREIILDVDLKG